MKVPHGTESVLEGVPDTDTVEAPQPSLPTAIEGVEASDAEEKGDEVIALAVPDTLALRLLELTRDAVPLELLNGDGDVDVATELDPPCGDTDGSRDGVLPLAGEPVTAEDTDVVSELAGDTEALCRMLRVEATDPEGDAVE